MGLEGRWVAMGDQRGEIKRIELLNKSFSSSFEFESKIFLFFSFFFSGEDERLGKK